MRYKFKVQVLGILLVGLCGFLHAAVAAPGDLDSTFGQNGVVRETIGGSSRDEISGTAIQPDGKIVVVGYVAYGQSTPCGIVRYNTDGSFDTSFNGDGKVFVQIGRQFNCYAVAIQADGKIVVAGYSTNSSNSDFALFRLNPTGALDTSFDGDGKVTTDFSSSNDYAYTVAIQTDGKIVTAGYIYNLTNSDFAIVRYNPNGLLDTSFDDDGKVLTDFFADTDSANAIAIQADGKIVAAGYSTNGSTQDFTIARYNPNGSLDTSFDGDGKVTTDFFSSRDVATAMVIQADGKIVAAGYGVDGSNKQVSKSIKAF